MSKFKIGDKVEVVGGWFLKEFRKTVIGTLTEIRSDSLKIELDETTKCKWEYKVLFVLKEDIIPAYISHTKLYKALK